jgi:hypothetical protein
VIAAVDHEAGGSDQIHPLEERRAAGEAADGHEQIAGKDQACPNPAGNFDQDEFRVQAASLRRT